MTHTALIIAHPGHELRLHAWLARVRPVVHILTDGSGSQGNPRIESTSRLLAEQGAEAGAVYGVLPDHEVYAALMRGDHAFFVGIARRLADELVRQDIRLVAGDAAEGFNPAHDVCRLVINAAVKLARHTSMEIENLEFPLVGPPWRKTKVAPPAVSLGLSDREWSRKLEAATQYMELAREIEGAKEAGLNSFRREILYPAADGHLDGLAETKPYYETFGEQRVKEGIYKEVLRRKDHVLPLARVLFDL
jgi:hypothetical protein